MTKRILVALDPDADTPVATRHAISIARRHSASLTGLAVVDAGHVETESHSSSLGGVYHTAAVQDRLTSEAQEHAKQLLKAFKETIEKTEIDYEEHVRQGMPFHCIIDEMKYHDLLVIGETPHFAYNQPRQRTKTLARVVRDTITPTFIVREDQEPPVRGVTIAFNAGDSSTRALHAFTQLKPFGAEVPVTLLHVHDDLPEASERLLEQARKYMRAHGFSSEPVSIRGTTPHEEIIAHVEKTDADVVVAGARSLSRLRQLTFGSVTTPLLDDCPAALFLHH